MSSIDKPKAKPAIPSDVLTDELGRPLTDEDGRPLTDGTTTKPDAETITESDESPILEGAPGEPIEGGEAEVLCGRRSLRLFENGVGRQRSADRGRLAERAALGGRAS